jgi:hypothetical protein
LVPAALRFTASRCDKQGGVQDRDPVTEERPGQTDPLAQTGSSLAEALGQVLYHESMGIVLRVRRGAWSLQSLRRSGLSHSAFLVGAPFLGARCGL